MRSEKVDMVEEREQLLEKGEAWLTGQRVKDDDLFVANAKNSKMLDIVNRSLACDRLVGVFRGVLILCHQCPVHFLSWSQGW